MIGFPGSTRVWTLILMMNSGSFHKMRCQNMIFHLNSIMCCSSLKRIRKGFVWCLARYMKSYSADFLCGSFNGDHHLHGDELNGSKLGGQSRVGNLLGTCGLRCAHEKSCQGWSVSSSVSLLDNNFISSSWLPSLTKFSLWWITWGWVASGSVRFPNWHHWVGEPDCLWFCFTPKSSFQAGFLCQARRVPPNQLDERLAHAGCLRGHSSSTHLQECCLPLCRLRWVHSLGPFSSHPILWTSGPRWTGRCCRWWRVNMLLAHPLTQFSNMRRVWSTVSLSLKTT